MVPFSALVPQAVTPTFFGLPALGPLATTGLNSQLRFQLVHFLHESYAVTSMFRWNPFRKSRPFGLGTVAHPDATKVAASKAGTSMRNIRDFMDTEYHILWFMSIETGPTRALAGVAMQRGASAFFEMCPYKISTKCCIS